MQNLKERALELHRANKGKLAVKSKVSVTTKDDLSLVYTPGVAEVCKEIAANKDLAYVYTCKANTVAVVSDGTAVLGLGDIGPYGAMPVMEGKAILFKELANIDAFPICLDTKDDDEIISIVKRIAPVFGGINLEDIAAPRCFKIERELQDLGIPVMHDDQHGTAVVTLAALINALKVVGKNITEATVVINGSGAAGIAVAKLLGCVDEDSKQCIPVRDIILCDTKGAIYQGRPDLNPEKEELAKHTNKLKKKGTLGDVLRGADVFIGLSKPNTLTGADIKNMSADAIVFAMANPTPEIMPDEALKAGVGIIGTGRSDFPNQINNSLAFPGIFRGALDAKAMRITNDMKIAAAHAIANAIKPTKDNILPYTLDKPVHMAVAKAVKEAAIKGGVCRA